MVLVKVDCARSYVLQAFRPSAGYLKRQAGSEVFMRTSSNTGKSKKYRKTCGPSRLTHGEQGDSDRQMRPRESGRTYLGEGGKIQSLPRREEEKSVTKVIGGEGKFARNS